MAGAVWTTTVFVGSSSASQTSSIWLRSCDGADGTDGGALAALDADDVAQSSGRTPGPIMRVKAAALGEQAADILDLVAHGDAAAAGMHLPCRG